MNEVKPAQRGALKLETEQKQQRICFTCLHYAGGYCLQHDKRVRAKQRACSEFLRSEYNTWLLEKQAEGET